MNEPTKPLATPEEHRLEEDLRICDPEKVDTTHPIEAWRVERMKGELARGFDFIRSYRLAATIFGSARSAPDHPSYQAATELAARLSRSGFTIVTGGAAGIMEAANKGAYEAKGESIGLNINLPQEQAANEYLTAQMDFNYFFTRKIMLAFASEVYIYFPGGYGTMNELFEILTLVQTKKIKPIPIILVGKDFWAPIVESLEKHLYEEHKYIDKEDLNLFVMVDTVDEAYDAVLKLVRC